MATARNGDITINYATVGEGRPLVLLHAFSDSLESWAEMGYTGPLAAAGYRLVLLDQRGHGASSKPHEPGAYGAEARARDVIAVLDALDLARADLLGYSMGGWTALNVARHHPDRVERLVVGGCHPFGQSMTFYRDGVGGGLEAWIALLERIGGRLSASWKRRLCGNDPAALRAVVAEDRPDISPSLAAFERPVLFYAGSDDPLRYDAVRAAALLPGGQSFEIPGANHLTAMLRADLALPPILAFLGEGRR